MSKFSNFPVCIERNCSNEQVQFAEKKDGQGQFPQNWFGYPAFKIGPNFFTRRDVCRFRKVIARARAGVYVDERCWIRCCGSI